MPKLLDIDGLASYFDMSEMIDISIPLNFNGEQPNAYGVEPAMSEPCVAGDLVGDTRQGGSCNFEQYTFIPHCNGTHTECVGHITRERISIRDCMRDVFIPARLITTAPISAADTDETYSMPMDAGDRLITRKMLEAASASGSRRDAAAGRSFRSSHAALVIRTLPNDERKLKRRYVDTVPPYFTNEAMQFIAESRFIHLLVDLPSIDRLFDEGRLSNHRIFWNVDQKSFDTGYNTRVHSTITELIYVPNAVEDGQYLLNLQIAPFAADASPSRPVLFPVAKN
ncbi:MAG TPA: cyclase family protein [Pyrinomonadaceae bacterium]|nr:cyclase family protein [Pyrinomonadaceae bacterium]